MDDNKNKDIKDAQAAAGETEAAANEATKAGSEEKSKDAETQGGKKGESKGEIKKLKAELERQKTICEKQKADADKELDKQKAAFDELNDKYMRMIAEYDNYRKRAVKEREGAYTDAYSDLLVQILPVLDNLERAEAACVSQNEAEGSPDIAKITEGVSLTLRSFKDVLSKLGIEEIEAEGKPFDPNLHNAVMHFESDEHDEATVTEVFQKGYKKGDRVIRYAMVKVAN